MDRSVDFYSHVLTFEKISDTEIAGENVEHLEGVFGLRMRVVRMRLGDESIELTQYLAPKAARFRLIPAATIVGFNTLRSLSATWTRPITVAPEQRRACFDRATTTSGLEQERRGHHGVLFQGSRRASGGDSGVSPRTRARRSGTNQRTALPRYRSHCDRRVGHRSAASSFIATCSECAWPERVKTTEPSRNI